MSPMTLVAVAAIIGWMLRNKAKHLKDPGDTGCGFLVLSAIFLIVLGRAIYLAW